MGASMHILKAHTAAIRCLAYSPDSSVLASGADYLGPLLLAAFLGRQP